MSRIGLFDEDKIGMRQSKSFDEPDGDVPWGHFARCMVRCELRPWGLAAHVLKWCVLSV